MSDPLALGLCGWSPHCVLPGPAPRVFPLALSLQHVTSVLPSFREPLSPGAISGLRGLPLPSDFFLLDSAQSIKSSFVIQKQRQKQRIVDFSSIEF